ncbi:hypothetical protein ACFWG0_35085 [Streptomyces yangpuensis]|uniref:hypothetical protein n=1 Tax=Streptomyces yangpuensis TaxID=1648182 RepID=UPI0036508189
MIALRSLFFSCGSSPFGAAVEEALKAADQPERGSASRHLRQAMDLAYALHPDPVKAYSEAIKAVECALHDTIQPNNRRATLGTIRSSPARRCPERTGLCSLAHDRVRGTDDLDDRDDRSGRWR